MSQNSPIRVEAAKNSKLLKYNPDLKQEEIKKPREVPFKWEFFEHEDTYVLETGLHGRMTWNDYWSTYFVHLGRKGRNGSATNISFSTYEASSILNFLEGILKQMEEHPLTTKNQKLIPHLDGKEANHAFAHDVVDSETFWKTPDMSLPSVKLRVGVNRMTGTYVLYMNAPVKPEISMKHHNWQGPKLLFSPTGMRVLLEYLELASKEALVERFE